MSWDDPRRATPDYTASAGVTGRAPAAASAPAQPVGMTPARARGRTGGVLLGVVGVVLAGLAVLAVAAYLLSGLGAVAFAVAGVMALVPLAIVFAGVRWVDRWEPEPLLPVLFAFLWGAGVSVLIALVVGAEIDRVLAVAGTRGPLTDFLAVAVQAPIVEEAGKGLGLLLVLWVGRRHFDGPVDGIVYAAWVAGGFAFTENILYFGSSLLDGSTAGQVFQTFVVRGLMSPFAHVLFTSAIGIALGLAARRTGRLGAIGYLVVGLLPAIALHALWNGALFFVSDFFGYYVLVQVPIFVGVILLVRFLRRQETRITFDRLSEYAAAGWFDAAELPALATPRGRRQAMAWAGTTGREGAMRRYIRDATRLAFARQRIITGRDTAAAVADEAGLLDAVVAARRSLTGR